MKEFYLNYESDELWLIKETEWVRALQGIRESQFALGNGYLGSRGVLEEIPYDAAPATFIAGIYDKMAAQVSELVNLPNPVNFKITNEGEKFDLVAMNSLAHKRILNMKKGLLTRRTLYQDSKRRKYSWRSLRFVSMHNKNIGVLQVAFTPLDDNCILDINTGIDASVSNAGVLTEGRKRHFRVQELGQAHGAGYLIVNTSEKKHTVVYWAGFHYKIGRKCVRAKDNIFRLKLKKNQTVIFTKVFFIKHFPYQLNPAVCKSAAAKVFFREFGKDFSLLIQEHIQAWEKLWKKADILIEGTANLQQNLRFNIYHMLICGNFDNGFSSIGARTLSGEGYRGHIFWDADIFLMPFYLFTFPRVAKNMLLYRYRTLSAAQANAKKDKYKGIKFVWESADTGEEETPEWARDIDGTIIKIHTHYMEHHITADVAYAVYKYYAATGDFEFMERYGYEMILGAAQFWASRVEFNKRKNKYEINNVIGPDEFHVGVNNNVFTNMMAKWNLLTAAKLFFQIRKKPQVYKILEEKLGLKEKEAKKWKEIAAHISVNITVDKVMEQFDGYFKLKNIRLGRMDENGIPLIPAALKAKNLKNTQLVKQADVLMLLYLLDDVFSKKTKEANYDFYTPRTVHRSSLSAAIHSLAAGEVGDLYKAFNFFNVSLRGDISNLYGNTREGVHAASLGGTWQAVVFGFAGVKIKKEKLFINPMMPRGWRKMVFSLAWRGYIVKFELTNEKIKIKAVSSKHKTIHIGVFNKVDCLKVNRSYVFERKTPWLEEDKAGLL